MNEPLIINRGLDVVSNETYEKIHDILDEIEIYDNQKDWLKNSQLSRLRSTALYTSDVKSVSRFVEAQVDRGNAAKDRKGFEGWFIPLGKTDISQYIRDFCSERASSFSAFYYADQIMESIATDSLTEKQKKEKRLFIASLALQKFIENFVVLYRYRRAVHQGDLDQSVEEEGDDE